MQTIFLNIAFMKQKLNNWNDIMQLRAHMYSLINYSMQHN